MPIKKTLDLDRLLSMFQTYSGEILNPLYSWNKGNFPFFRTNSLCSYNYQTLYKEVLVVSTLRKEL